MPDAERVPRPEPREGAGPGGQHASPGLQRPAAPGDGSAPRPPTCREEVCFVVNKILGFIPSSPRFFRFVPPLAGKSPPDPRPAQPGVPRSTHGRRAGGQSSAGSDRLAAAAAASCPPSLRNDVRSELGVERK